MTRTKGETSQADTVAIECVTAASSPPEAGGLWPFVQLVSDYTGRMLVLHRDLIGAVADQGDNRVRITPRGKGGRGWLVRGSAGEVLGQMRRAFGCEVQPTPQDRGGPPP